MALAYALAPKRIVLSIREDSLSKHTVKGKQARIPADGNDTDFLAPFACFVHPAEMFGNFCVGIEAVNYIKIPRKLRRLLRQVIRAASAENRHVDFIPQFWGFLHRINRHTGFGPYTFGVSSGKKRNKLHIAALSDSAFYAAAQVPIPRDCDSDFQNKSSFLNISHRIAPAFICKIIQRKPCGKSGVRRS